MAHLQLVKLTHLWYQLGRCHPTNKTLLLRDREAYHM